MGPSLRHLHVFRLFSRVLNVTETAHILHISQPSVSQALKELEQSLGIELIIRGKGPLKLTADAQLLLKDIDEILEQMQGLRERASRLRGEHTLAASIATVHPLTGSILPRIIRDIRRDTPKARIRIEAFSSREVVQRVVERHADIGFTFLPVDVPDLIVRPLLRTDMVCLLPAGNRLAGAAVITPADLKDEVIITLGAQVRQEFDVRRAFDYPEDDARFLTTNHSIVSLDLVRQGVGVAVTLPFVLDPEHLHDVVAVPFKPEITRTLVATYLRKPAISPLVRRALKEVHEQLQAFSRQLEMMGLPSHLTGSAP